MPDFLTRVRQATAADDIDALQGLVATALDLGEAERRALADGLETCSGQIRMDIAAGKFEPGPGYAICVALARDGQRLLPGDPGPLLSEAGCRVDRVASAVADPEGLDLRDDADAALAVLAPLLDDPRREAAVDLVAGEAWILIAGLDLDGAAAQRGFARLREAYLRGERGRAASAWLHYAERLLTSGEQALAEAGSSALRAAHAFADERTAAEPVEAASWAEVHQRRDDPRRAAAFLPRIPCPPGLDAETAGSVGHIAGSCGSDLGDPAILRIALAFHRHALAQQPLNPFRKLYVADICRRLAAMPGTEPDEVRRLHDEALAAYRTQALAPGTLQHDLNLAELLVDRAAALGFAADHPELEEACRLGEGLQPEHGGSYGQVYEIVARARLAQGREGEALAQLRTCLVRLAPYIDADEIAGRSWFRALPPAQAARLRQGMAAG